LPASFIVSQSTLLVRSRTGTEAFAALGTLLLLGLAADAAAGSEVPATGAAAIRDADAAEPDWPGLRRDTAYVLSYQVAMIGILYALPESISNWSEEQKEEYSLSQWWENVSNPQWDDDKFWINYLAHPYWGAAYYVRARERGFDERASFWYSVAMSTAFEFGAEALFEQPSIQDLIVTPVGGVILGEYFMAWRARVIDRHEPGQRMPFRDRALLALTDPLGAINSRVQSWLGVESESSFYPYASVRPVGGARSFAPDHVDTERVYGVQLNYRW
jgi:hypothetical protein